MPLYLWFLCFFHNPDSPASASRRDDSSWDYPRATSSLKFGDLLNRPIAQHFRLAQKGCVARPERLKVPLNLALQDHQLLRGGRNRVIQSGEDVCTSTAVDGIGPCRRPTGRRCRVPRLILQLRDRRIAERFGDVVEKGLFPTLDA